MRVPLYQTNPDLNPDPALVGCNALIHLEIVGRELDVSFTAQEFNTLWKDAVRLAFINGRRELTNPDHFMDHACRFKGFTNVRMRQIGGQEKGSAETFWPWVPVEQRKYRYEARKWRVKYSDDPVKDARLRKIYGGFHHTLFDHKTGEMYDPDGRLNLVEMVRSLYYTRIA